MSLRDSQPRGTSHGPDDVSSQIGADYTGGGYGVSSRASSRPPAGHGPAGYPYDTGGGELASFYGAPSGPVDDGRSAAAAAAAGSAAVHDESMQRAVPAVTGSRPMASSSSSADGAGREGEGEGDHAQRRQPQQRQEEEHQHDRHNHQHRHHHHQFVGAEGGEGERGSSRSSFWRPSPVALASDMRRVGEGTSMRRVSGDSTGGGAKGAIMPVGEPAGATGGGGGGGAAVLEAGSAVVGRSSSPTSFR